MESCGGANYWARVFQRQGHTVKLISPQYVKPFVKTNKNDANDAKAITEAAAPGCPYHLDGNHSLSSSAVRNSSSSTAIGFASNPSGF
jgi:hypothetical protein